MVETEVAKELTYEQKVERLDSILRRLDQSSTPIDALADDVQEGTRLIKDLHRKLESVEMQVRDAFKELDGLQAVEEAEKY